VRKQRNDWLAAGEFVPDDAIPKGDETDRLHRLGVPVLSEMFQPLASFWALNWSARLVSAQKGRGLLHALANKPLDLLRYQNLLCPPIRWRSSP